MVGSLPAGFQNIGAESLKEQGLNTKSQGENAGANIANSETGKLALAHRERQEETKKKFDSTLQNLKAQQTEQQGQQNVQQGGQQQAVGGVMVQTGTALIAASSGTFGATMGIGLAMIAGGTATMLSGQNQQQQGEQQVAEAPQYQAKAGQMEQQSDTHGANATQLEAEAQEEEMQAQEETDPDSAKGQGEQKGYFVGDDMADASSGEASTIDKLRDGEDAINGITGIDKDGEIVANAGTLGEDDQLLADQINAGTDRIKELTGEDTETISAEDPSYLDVATKLNLGEEAVDELIKEGKIG